MAYFLHHIVGFKNPLNENILIELYKKDVEPAGVTPLLATSFKMSYPSGGKFEGCIWASEMQLDIFLTTDDSQTFDDFIVTFDDEWKVIARDDDQIIFTGFLTPGLGRAEFQDKPYDISLKAIDGIGLLKGVPLTKPDGSNFVGVNLIKDYISAILSKTGLSLGWRLYSNIVESSMKDRTQDQLKDTFNQTAIHARSFLKDSNEFFDCYTCLQHILGEYYTLYQWNGRWVILRFGELQDSIGAKVWYTEYNNVGAVVSSAQQLEDPGAVGRDRLIHPVEAAQFISSDFAIKSARYTYNYKPWPEIPTNNTFERGTAFRSGTNGDGTTYTDYSTPGWTYGAKFTSALPNLSPTTDIAYRRSIYDIYGVEKERQLILEHFTSGEKILQSEPFEVSQGDKINVDFDIKYLSGGTGTRNLVFVYIVQDGTGVKYYLSRSYSGSTELKPVWQPGTGNAIQLQVNDFSEWSSSNCESPPIPVTGAMYIAMASNINANTPVFRNFRIEYQPFIAGGYKQMKGDYAETSQNLSFKDVIDKEVMISDSPRKVLQGALYRPDLISLTTPTWKRYGKNEARHFKELGELVRYNFMRRRMFQIQGPFDGLKYIPANNALVIEPLSFHRHYTFPDSQKMAGRYFVLVPPLNIDYSEGRADMNFVEVMKDGENDGNQLGNNHIPHKFLFE
jgi:hypothetical protein